ncbi:MAG: STAS domain-containing protein [Actinomycetes bacterium]
MSEAVVLDLNGMVERADVPLLCRRLLRLLDDATDGIVVCDVSRMTSADTTTIEALARLQLTAKRHGAAVVLRGAGHHLTCLLAVAGLTDVLPAEPPSALGVGREAEQREEVRVEEVRDADDPPLGHPQ